MSGRKGTQLTKFEFEILSWYFDCCGNDYTDIKYQVRVGVHTEYQYTKNRKLKRAIEDAYKLKIDCVARRKSGEVDIIEVKDVASVGAIGQLLAYKVLYDNVNERKIILTLLCRYANENVRKVCSVYKINILEMGGR